MDSLKDKIEFRVRWEPFLLKPDIPADGIPKPAAYTDPSNPRWDNTFWFPVKTVLVDNYIVEQKQLQTIWLISK
jgi:hypothetical protein